MSSIHLRPAAETDIREFRAWHYPSPYNVYDLSEGRLRDGIAYFLRTEVACHVLVDDSGAVVGYCTFGPDGRVPGGDYAQAALDIGLGVRPDLIGRGRGSSWVDAVCRFAAAQFEPDRLRVTIAAWNGRALTVWEAAGFRSVQRFARSGESGTNEEFIVLERSTSPGEPPAPPPKP